MTSSLWNWLLFTLIQGDKVKSVCVTLNECYLRAANSSGNKLNRFLIEITSHPLVFCLFLLLSFWDCRSTKLLRLFSGNLPAMFTIFASFQTYQVMGKSGIQNQETAVWTPYGDALNNSNASVDYFIKFDNPGVSYSFIVKSNTSEGTALNDSQTVQCTIGKLIISPWYHKLKCWSWKVKSWALNFVARYPHGT